MSDHGLLGGRYRRERMIGAGAMGQVWLAEDTLLHRTVAIKNVTPATVVSGLATPVQDDLLERIAREARLAARMSHPNAVSVYDLVTVDGQPHLVMEYVAGVTLAEEIRNRGVLPLDRVATIGAAVADALADAHELGIVHRDVKPANILLDRRGRPKLADFGIARVSGDGTATGTMLGTPAFVAPEVARGEAATSASDIWSLAVTLYAAVEGRTPFESGHDDSPIVLLGRILTNAPPAPPHGGALTPVLMRMLARDPQFRPTAAEVATQLRGAGEQSHPAQSDTTRRVAAAPREQPRSAPTSRAAVSTPLPPPAEVQPAAPEHKRPAWPYLVGAACAVAIIAAGTFLLVRQSTEPSTPAGQGVSSTPGTSVAPQVRTETRTSTQTIPAPPGSTTPESGEPSYGGPDETEAYDFADSDVTMSVPGPAGFLVTAETAGSTAQYHNFVYQDATAQTTNAFLHIGVGDRTAGTFEEAYRDAVSFQQTRKDYSQRRVLAQSTTTYCGVQAADIEFSGTNDDGIARHGVQRIWISQGEVLIVQINAPESEWASWSPWFEQMVSSCVED